MKILIFLLTFFTLTLNVFAIGRGEKQYLFKNKITGEYKQTYQILYRRDFEEFRDALNSYISNYELPNSGIFKNWEVISYKICDREICETKGDNVDLHNNYPKITASDFNDDEVKIINKYKTNDNNYDIILFLIIYFIFNPYICFLLILSLVIFFIVKKLKTKSPE